ncbi:MAG: M67 family metallopeptidase [Magnetococcales bacterium]|nr:M67 family metallopeptidase [Magnetococcales bacterium]
MWVIPRVIINKILGHAQRCAPEECVGVLSGKDQDITGWHPLENSLRETSRFLADPKQQIELFKKLRGEQKEVVAIYHSHPASSPVPSELDLSQSEYQNALYLIVSLGTEGCLEINGYLIKDGQASPESLTIKD